MRISRENARSARATRRGKLAPLLALLALFGLGSVSVAADVPDDLGGFELVRDLETDPGHLSFLGHIYEADTAKLAYAHRALWRLAEPGGEAMPLVRDVARAADVQPLGSGLYVARGADLVTGERGFFVTDGGAPRRIAPPEFAAQNPWYAPQLAGFGRVVLAKTQGGALGDGLWRLTEHAAPVRLGPSGAYLYAGDPTYGYWCAGVFPTPVGFVHCRRDDGGSTRVWLHDGVGEVPVPGLVVDELVSWTELGGFVYVVAASGDGRVLFRTDGTLGGTEVIESIYWHDLFVWDGLLGWIQEDVEGSLLIRVTDGVSDPVTVTTIPRAGFAGVQGVAGGALWLQWVDLDLPGWHCSFSAVSKGGVVSAVDTGGLCARSVVVDAPMRGGGLVFLSDPYGTSTPRNWQLFAVSNLGVENVATAQILPGSPLPVLNAQNGDPHVPWLDAAGRPRIAKVDLDGVAFGHELAVAGTSGSNPRLLGEVAGEMLAFAHTSEHGAKLWRSRGSPETTTIVEGVSSRCRQPSRGAPGLVGPDTIVDCVDHNWNVRAWILPDLSAPIEVELDVLGSDAPGAQPYHYFSQAPGVVVHTRGLAVVAQAPGGVPAATLIETCRSPRFLALPQRVLVACREASGMRIYASDGSAASTTVVLELPSTWGLELVAVGAMAVITDYAESWLTDGTQQGTHSLGAIAAVAGFRGGSHWACAWTADGTIVRLDLLTREVEVLAETGAVLIRAAASESDSTIYPLQVFYPGGSSVELWRCDGTSRGTHLLVPSWPFGPEQAAVSGTSMWTHDVTDGREVIRRLSLDTGSTETLVDRPIPLVDDPLGGSSPAVQPLLLGGGFLWTVFASDDHGREPRVLSLPIVELFADGFETGDTSAWSAVE